MKINITDLKKLQILKVKPWAVDFSYDGSRYLLHQSSECDEQIITLYEKNVDKYGIYKLNLIKAEYGGLNGFEWTKLQRQGTTYKNANKKYFVKKLIKYQFAEGIFSDEYKKLTERKDDILSQIKALENEINNIDKKFWEE